MIARCAVLGKEETVNRVAYRRSRRLLTRRARSIAATMACGFLLAVAPTSRPAASPSSVPGYSITDLGTLGGGNTLPWAVNNLGQVVGWATVPGGSGTGSGCLYDASGLHRLDFPDARAINDAGQVAGQGPGGHAVLYKDGVLHDLGTIGGGQHSISLAINALGHVVGWTDTQPGSDSRSGTHAFLYDGTSMQDLGSLPGLDFSTAEGINASDQVVGGSFVYGQSITHAFLWDKGVMQDLNPPGSTQSWGWGINDAGQVVGTVRFGGAPRLHAFLYDSTGMHDLGTLGGGWSAARGINNAGQIVGTSETADLNNTSVYGHPFLYSGGVMHDLNALLLTSAPWEQFAALGINDRGQIIGQGFSGVDTDHPQSRAYLLTPDPTAHVAPPAAPSNLAVKFVPLRELDLTWADNSDNEQRFEIQRRRFWSDWATVATVGPNTMTFSDVTVGAYIHYMYRVRAVNAVGASAWSDMASSDVGTGAWASLGWGSHDFGSTPLGSSSDPWALTVTNAGTGTLQIQSLTLAGDNAGDFVIVDSPTSVAPADTAVIHLAFTPTALGSRKAELTFTSSAENKEVTVRLSGTAVTPPVPTLGLSPDSLDFGQQPVGLNGSLALLLQNTGNVPLKVSSIAIQGPNAGEFTLAPGGWSGGTLQPGRISLLNVRFSPAMTGSRSASLVISDDAANSPQLVSLTGVGTAPLLTLSADTLVFGVQPANAAQTLILTNHGDAPLTVDGVGLAGPDAGSFHIVTDTGEKNLAVGASRTLTLSFSPAAVASRRARIAAARIAAVSYSATLEIHDNDPHPGAPHQVTLTAVTVAGPAPGAAPPAAPTNLAATVTPANQIALTWTDNSSNETAFAIWRQTGDGAFGRVGVVAPHTTHFTDTGLTPNINYTYEVRATNNVGASAWSNPATVALLPPAAPTHLAATAPSASQVDLTWTDNSDNETAFAIWRQTGGGAFVRVGVVAPHTTHFSDTGLMPNTAYTYEVRATNNVGASAWSHEAPATTLEAPPAAPANLTASVVSAGEIDLTWTRGGGNETGIAIFRRMGGGGWQRLAVVAPSVTRYADRSVQPVTSYRYQVRAHNNHFVSAWTNTVSGLTPPAP
jgi:probable HAF family extracellular repeat protein